MTSVTRPHNEQATPVHARISDSLRSRIRSGELPVGSQLPSEAELMREFGVARGTVRRALQTLDEHGLVHVIQGKGTFVRTGRAEPSIGQTLVGLGETLSYSEQSLVTKVLDQKVVPASQYPDFPGECPEGTQLLVLDRVRSLGDVPVARMKNWIRLDLAPGIEGTDFTSTALFSALDRLAVGKVSAGQRTFEAVLGDEDVSQSLSISRTVPLLFLRQVTYLADGTPVECSDVWMDSKQVAVSMMLKRN